MHPIYRALLAQPELLAEHAAAYAELASRAAGDTVTGWAQRALWLVLAGVCAVLGTGFAGGAVMLWAVQPQGLGTGAIGWLVGVPGATLCIAALALWLGLRKPVGGAFATMREQIDADLALLQRAAST